MKIKWNIGDLMRYFVLLMQNSMWKYIYLFKKILLTVEPTQFYGLVNCMETWHLERSNNHSQPTSTLQADFSMFKLWMPADFFLEVELYLLNNTESVSRALWAYSVWTADRGPEAYLPSHQSPPLPSEMTPPVDNKYGWVLTSAAKSPTWTCHLRHGRRNLLSW